MYFKIRFYELLHIKTVIIKASDTSHAHKKINKLYPDHGDFIQCEKIDYKRIEKH